MVVFALPRCQLLRVLAVNDPHQHLPQGIVLIQRATFPRDARRLCLRSPYSRLLASDSGKLYRQARKVGDKTIITQVSPEDILR